MKHSIKRVISNGHIFGNLVVLSKTKEIISNDQSNEVLRFKNAIKKALNQISQMKQNNKDLIDYLTVQELMIADPMLEKKVIDYITKNNETAINSVKYAINEYSLGLMNSTSTYLKERVSDLEDICNRIIFNLNDGNMPSNNEKYIIAIDKLYPSILISLKDNILGIIAKNGGYTSHAAILCRSWDIPFVLCDDDFNDYDKAIIDTGKNLIISNPSDDEIIEFNNDYNKRISFDKKAVKHDGYNFLANVSSNLDLDRVIDYDFDGVGLYRTEMIFMNTNRAYTTEEQYSIYLEAVNKMGDKGICFRTFDIGDDKNIPYIKASKKGIENYINNPDIFISQIKALLMANINNNIRIMFPMIETNDEFLYLKNWVLNINKELNCNLPKIGMMLETKKALENIEDFKDTDFISIGTNDLTSELYSINRDSSVDMVDDYLSDLIEKLKKVVSFCDDNDICLSICGELASVRKVAEAFYNIGIKNLSVSPSRIRMLNSLYTDFISK